MLLVKWSCVLCWVAAILVGNLWHGAVDKRFDLLQSLSPRIGGVTGGTVNWFGPSPLLLPCLKHFQLDLAWVNKGPGVVVWTQWSFLRLLPKCFGMVQCHRQVRPPLVANPSKDWLADQLSNFFCLPYKKLLVYGLMVGTWNTLSCKDLFFRNLIYLMWIVGKSTCNCGRT